VHLDDVWLQTTLNTPNISGVWQIKKWSLVATFLVSLVLGFGGNVTASSDKSDQRLSGNDFIKSFSLHQLKKADNHDTQCLICQYKSSCRTIECFTIPKPNDMSTVFTTMKRCLDMTKAMGQVHSVQTFDQQLYAIKQVEWVIPETFRNHTV
jgi:hypothetical protein